MNKITAADLYKLFLDTLGRCTPAIRDLSDELILYNIYEEFDTDAWSFLHGYSLYRLRAAGLIDDETVEMSKEVRSRWLSLRDQKNWSIAEIKSNHEWEDLFKLCDIIRNKCGGGVTLTTENPPANEG